MSESLTRFFVMSERLLEFFCGLILLVVSAGGLRHVVFFFLSAGCFLLSRDFCCGPGMAFFMFWELFESSVACLRCPLLASGPRPFRAGREK